MIEIIYAPGDSKWANEYRVMYVDFSAARSYKALGNHSAVWTGDRSSGGTTGTNLHLTLSLRHYQPIWANDD